MRVTQLFIYIIQAKSVNCQAKKEERRKKNEEN